jgi:hypothetical protein
MASESVQFERSAESCRLSDDAVRLTFRRADDRWEHVIEVRSGSGWRLAACSVEGTSADAAPPSPPFQDLHTESTGLGRHEVQLLGQSGKTLYSAAVRFDSRAGCIEYDVAARIVPAQAPPQLLSTYRLPAPSGSPRSLAREAEDGSVVLGENLRVVPIAIKGSPLTTCRITMKSGDEQAAVGCVDLSGVTWERRGTTLRWGYRIAWNALS